jgi:AcrR family transcriptional regulator
MAKTRENVHPADSAPTTPSRLRKSLRRAPEKPVTHRHPGASRAAGRRRSPAADDAIISATLQLLAEVGYGGLTMLAVLERSGVSSATLYRRWTTKHDLVMAALSSIPRGTPPADTGSLAGDLKSFVASVSRAVHTDHGFVALGVEVQFNEELRSMFRSVFVESRVQQMDAVLRRAADRGELSGPRAPDVVLSLMVGPILYRVFTLCEKLTPAFLSAVVTSVLAGLSK